MNEVRFQNEITDRLGSTPVSFALKQFFLRKKELLKTVGEIRIRTKMPLCVIDGNKKDKYFINSYGNTVEADESYMPTKEEINRIFTSICRLPMKILPLLILVDRQSFCMIATLTL